MLSIHFKCALNLTTHIHAYLDFVMNSISKGVRVVLDGKWIITHVHALNTINIYYNNNPLNLLVTRTVVETVAENV